MGCRRTATVRNGSSAAYIFIAAAVLWAPAGLLAQSSSGSVVFPAATETNVTDCSVPEPPLPGPAGGTVRLRGGQYINRGGTLYTTSIGGCTSSELGITFSPAASAVTITVKTLLLSVSDQILFEITEPGGRTSKQFTVQPQGSVTLNAQGEIGSVVIRSVRTGIPTNVWGFGVAEISLTQGPVNNSVVTFNAANGADDSKILISKAVWDIGYPSHFQLAPDGSGNPRIKISGTLRDRFSGQGTPGPVHLRIDDPPDPAPYRGADASSGDNDGAASFNGSATATLQADSQGRFETEFVVTGWTAGDNYVVVGSTNAQFGCGGTPCPRSPVFTLWKRIYVEEQQMFRRGAFLNNEAPAGTNEIPIHDPVPFLGLAAGEMLQLVHAESGSGAGFYSDQVAFESLKQNPTGNWIIVTAPATRVPRKYGETTNSNISPNPFIDVMRDGVGVVSAGTFKSNASYTAPFFDSMFVELKPIAGAVIEVPYVADMQKQFAPLFANRWLQQGVRTSTFGSKPDPNVFHRIAARQSPLVKSQNLCSGAQVGITSVAAGGNYSFIFDQRIQDLAAGIVVDPTTGCPPVGLEYKNAPASVVNGEVTAHEAVHFWVRTARLPGMDAEGHCTKSHYTGAANCLMHEPYAGPELFDGQVLLHYDMNGAHSEYMFIRRDPDPVPQQ